jgi:hypothetical protein
LVRWSRRPAKHGLLLTLAGQRSRPWIPWNTPRPLSPGLRGTPLSRWSAFTFTPTPSVTYYVTKDTRNLGSKTTENSIRDRYPKPNSNRCWKPARQVNGTRPGTLLLNLPTQTPYWPHPCWEPTRDQRTHIQPTHTQGGQRAPETSLSHPQQPEPSQADRRNVQASSSSSTETSSPR